MAVLTPLTSLDMRSVLRGYGLGEYERHWPAAEGIENTNYFVRVTGQRGHREFVLTVLENSAAPERALLPVLQAAGRAGLPVATPLPDRHGQTVVRVAGKPALLSPRLSGAHPDQPDLQHCAAIGRFLGRFHRSCHGLVDVPEHPRNAAWLTAKARHTRAFLPWDARAQLDAAVAAVSTLLARQDVRQLPHGVVHGDLFRDNALVANEQLTGVLDFHHASRAALVFDLAVTINDWCVDAPGQPDIRQLDMARVWALLRAYDGVRALTRGELWFLPAFALLAATAFWLSRLDVHLASGSPPSRNPAEMAALVAGHWRRPLVLDERLLRVRSVRSGEIG